MKKGFTLIELLAVIVILAIIAIIAVTIVLNIMEQMHIYMITYHHTITFKRML